jgi:hypothetical protein
MALSNYVVSSIHTQLDLLTRLKVREPWGLSHPEHTKIMRVPGV